MLSARCLHTLLRPLSPARLLSLGLLLAGFVCAPPGARAAEEATTLLDTGKTIMGQPFSYPTGAPAKVTAEVITMQPGEERGWHKHDVPLVGYILDGELTIDFGPQGKKVFRKGEAFVEAIGVTHNGRNLGSGPVRILAVFIGAEGMPDTVKVAPPQ